MRKRVTFESGAKILNWNFYEYKKAVFVDPRSGPRPVLLDVDSGTDDALALLLLLAADAVGEVKLLGISCVAGNTTLDNVCRNTLRILRAANRLDIPVFAGAEGPLVSERPIRNTYHGQDGFGDLQHQDDSALEGLLQEENAVVALNRIVSANKGEVSLVCLAPLTNIALAMRTFPSFKKSLRDLHIMGGNARGIGNTTPAAEFNFATDPEAAHVVLSTAECPVQLTPWEPCPEHPVCMDWRLNEFPAGGRGGEAMRLVTEADRSVLGSHDKTQWVCCDQLAVAALLRPALVRGHHSRHLTVELAGSCTRGQVVPTCMGATCPPQCSGRGPGQPGLPPRPLVTVLDAFDMDAFKDLLLWAAERWTKK